jgi:succinate-acetate transporter protein
VLRPIATPLSLGFLGLGGATLTLSALQLGWVPASEKASVGLVLLCFGAGMQLIATVYGFLSRDAVASTGMGVLTGTWLATGLVTFTSPAHRMTSGALAFALFAAGTALAVPAVAALESKGLAALVLAGASVRFFLTGAYELDGGAHWKSVAGWAGVALFGLAVVAALAFELEDTKRRRLALTMRRRRGAQALAEDLVAEVTGVQHEAGVREQL